jgi:hypothetical protein
MNVWILLEEVVDFPLRCIARVSVTFLHTADQPFGITFDAIQVVIRQRTPTRFNVAFQLMPFSFEDVCVHSGAPIFSETRRQTTLQDGPSAAEQPKHEQDKGHYQQNMNEGAYRIGADHAQQPQHKQNRRYRK